MFKYNLESLEGVDEAHQGFYKEAEGGGFVLQVEGAVPQSKFNEVNQKMVDATTEAARRRKTNERIVGKLGLDDAGGLDDALDALIAGQGNGGKNDSDHQAVIDQIRADAASESAALKGELANIRMEGAKSQLDAAVMAAGFHPEIIQEITALAISRVQLDESGKLRIMSKDNTPLAGSGVDGFATMADLASELAAAKPSFLVDQGKGGGGKPPASGGGSSVPNSQFGGLAAKVPGFSDLPVS